MQYLFFIIGLAVVGLGIYAKVHSNRMYKLGITKATVVGHQPAVKKIGQTEIPCTQVTLEIPVEFGAVNKTVLDNSTYNVGDVVDIYYDSEKDYVEFPKNISEKGSKGPYVLMAFGAMISLLVLFAELSKSSAAISEGFTMILSYFVVFALILGGAFLAIIRPMRRKKEMVNCRMVSGKLVDYYRDSHGRNRGESTYKPIYEFYDNGETVRIEGEQSSSGSRNRQIGREVTIVINDKTGERYCLDDMAGIRKVAFLCLAFGVVVLFILVSKGFDGNSGEELNIGRSGYDLELNEAGYSIGSITMPEDERYYEYYYMPASEEETYAYNVKLYDYGVGVVTIFPMESNGKGLNQSFAFYMEYEDLKPIIKAGKEYDFEELAGATQNPDTAQGKVEYEYLYYYDGKNREGSGGYGVDSETFDTLAEYIKAAVPKNVWRAVKEEMRQYYE
ncbi:MAG: hypothetical protein IJ324_07375 [Lachnospiraceae bacterium]|nr:hypothetical protein [Lachnospiraceae bacterium]